MCCTASDGAARWPAGDFLKDSGKFFRAQEASALTGIYAAIDQLERAPIKSIEYREYKDLGPMLLLLAAALIALHTLLAGTLAFRIP